jgi:hypothetical protein
MDAKDLELLQASFSAMGRRAQHQWPVAAKTRRSPLADGEVIVADVLLVSEEDQDIIFDVVSTNRPDASRIGCMSHTL